MYFTISQPTRHDYPVLVDIWEASVNATHHFIPEAYMQQIKPMLDQYFDWVTLHAIRNDQQQIIGFSGTAGQKIEMLFIHPDWFGQGVGRSLVRHAIREMNACQVDVNEQNTGACEFYRHLGFRVIGRSETDSLGKPYPILHLELIAGADSVD